jgi:hypothetical protein
MVPFTREAPPRRPGQIGRPRIKGERLPNLCAVVEDPLTVWEPTEIASWYGNEQRTVEIASQTAVWYSTGLPAVPVRWVLVRDPEGEFKAQALLCIDLDADPEQIVRWYVMRWQLEVTIQEARRHLGFETQRQWTELAIRRTTPALLWGCSRWSPCSPMGGWCGQRVLLGRRLGTTRGVLPSLRLWRW